MLSVFHTRKCSAQCIIRIMNIAKIKKTICLRLNLQETKSKFNRLLCDFGQYIPII